MTLNREDYLLVMWEFIESFGSITEKALADRLKISPPTAHEYLQKLTDAGLIIKKRGDIRFTPDGHRQAIDLVRMHRVTEVFAHRFLEIPWEDTHSSVMELEHLFSGDKGDKLFKNLGNPETCPHGNPTDPLRPEVEVSLTLAPEGKYIFKRISFEERDILRSLSSLNCLPGTWVEIIKSPDEFVMVTENGEIKIPENLSLAVRLSRERG
ncbi:MAG: metal-dependent transcriptional regulator [Candidatus Thermoplasmatota archaeon]|nr:metal-dependent transcriptional regulator [Candidatus Thermoplasmatota archaeon]